MTVASIGGRARWLISGRTGVAAIVQTLLTQALMLAAYVGTGVISARSLGPAGRGELAAISLIPTVVNAFVTLGIPAALLYHLKRSPGASRRLIGAGFTLALLLGMLAVGISELVIPYAFRQYTPDVVRMARWFTLILPVALTSFIVWTVFEANGDFWSTNRSRLAVPLITLSLLVAFKLTVGVTVFTAALAYTLPFVPVVLVATWTIVRRYKPIIPRSLTPYRKLFSYGIKSYGTDVLKLIGSQADQVLIVAFLPAKQMGLYAVSISLAATLQLLQVSVSRVLTPRVAARSVEEVVDVVGRAARVACALMFVGCIGLLVLGPLLLTLLYGNRFEGAIPVMRILSVEAFITGSIAVLVQAFLALGRPGIVTMFQTAGLALSIPLMLVLIPRVGLTGAASALLIATVVRAVVVIASYRWLLHVAPPRLLLTGDDVRYVLARLRAETPQEAA